MMTKQRSTFALSTITLYATMEPKADSLNSNDVLFGRGNECSFYVGTKRFRDLVDTKKEAYMAAKKHAEKNAIAAEVVATIREKGGRFLKQDETVEPVDDIIKDGTWIEVKDEKEILNKAKQALRQKKNPILSSAKRGPDEQNATRNPEDGFENMVPPFLPSAEFSMMNLLPSPVPALDPRLLLFHPAAVPLLWQQQQALLASTLTNTTLLQPGSFAPAANPVANTSPTTVQSARFTSDNITASDGDQKPPAINDSKQSPLSSSENNEEVSEDVEEFLLSVLQLSGLPTFTDHATERANMTDEERAAALSDMYGRYCNVDVHKSKKTRQDLDQESIAFLIKHMRSEIKRVPVEKKRALLEAQLKCDAQEFSDDRLERFLRVERMDAQLAARRFVLYWEKRKEVFGPEKFTMRMTLSEALCDDLVALEVGFFQLLPKLDSSGRQLMLLTPAYHNKEGYTSDSLLRAAWYVVEVASRSKNDADGGVVELVNDKGCTVWEYDHWVYTRFTDLLLTCWPCRFDCFHVLNAPEFISRVLIPIICALQTKESRARNNFHDVPEDGIVSALAEFGITGDMLPTEFGGSIQLNPSEWLARRRSVEMEEL